MRNRSTPRSTSTGHTASRNTAAKTSVPSDALGATFLAAKATAKCPMNTSPPPHRANSGAFVQTREDELAMSERFRGGEPALRGTQHHLEELVARLVHVDLTAGYAGYVDVDVFGHEAHRARVGAELDHGQDRVADHVALPRRKEVHRVAARRAQGHHLGRGRGGIHEPQPRAARDLRLVEHAVHHALLADLLDIAERLLLDRGEAAGDVALGRLRIHEVAGFVAVDHLLVAIEHEHELVADFGRPAARSHELLPAGKLGRFTENERHTVSVELVEGVADTGVRADA